MENKLPSKMPNFEFVPELAQYMVKQIDSKNDYLMWYDAPDQVCDAFNNLSGTRKKRYDLLRELSNAGNTAKDVEDYICEIEAPANNSDLLEWVKQFGRIAEAEDILKENGESIIGAISIAWCNSHAEMLLEAVEVLEKYLNCGEDE